MPAPIQTLLRRAREGNHHAGLEAAQRPEADAGQLEEISHNPLPEARRAVALHPNAGPDTIRRLAYDPDSSVAGGVAGRAEIAPEILESILLRIQADFAVRTGRERARALDLTLALADNPAVPLAVVGRLVDEAPTAHVPRLLARQCSRPEVQDLLLDHRKATARTELVSNPHLTYAQAVALRDDRNAKTAAAAEARIRRDFQSEEDAAEVALYDLVRERGNARAETYAADGDRLAGGPEVRERILAWFEDRIPPRVERFVDLGCADGALTAVLQRAAPAAEGVGLDASPDLLQRARAAAPGVEFLEADLRGPLPFAPETTFDLIASWEALHAVPDLQAAVGTLSGRLAPGGRLLLVLACLADDGEDNRILAEVAADCGYFLLPFDEASTILATSGLVIESLSPAPEVTPGADLATAETLAWPGWAAILQEAAAAGARPEGMRRARLYAAAHPATI